MADRSHSETENSRNGRHLTVDTVNKLISTFKENILNVLEDDQIVKIDLDQVSNEIFKTYFKWYKFIVTDDASVKNPIVHITYKDNHISVLHDSHETLIPIESNLKDQLLEHYESFNKKFLEFSNFTGIDCQSHDNFTDKLNGILVMRESHLHQSEFYKDCIITSNNADIDTIRALEQTQTVSLPVHCEDNKLDVSGIKDHCEQSEEFIAGIIIPEEVDVTKEIIDLVHKTNGYVYKQCSYKELLNARTYYELGVDILGFGPIATIEELSVYLPRSEETGTSLSYGRIYTTPANTVSVELLKTLVSNV